MSADLLHRAASLMRERAWAASTHTPWQLLEDDDYAPPWTVASTHPEGQRTWVCKDARYAGEHIASWHPAVALAVADWLDEVGRNVAKYEASVVACRDTESLGQDCGCSYKDCYECGKWHNCSHNRPSPVAALAVARAYLGEQA